MAYLEEAAQYKRRGWREAGISSHRVRSYLFELQFYAGVTVFTTKNKQETVDTVLALEEMFQKPPEEHTSLLGFHESPEPVVGLGQRPSFLRRFLKELPGIGWELSKRIEDHAIRKGDGRVIDLIKWFRDDWEEVEGVGKGLSAQITEALGYPAIN